MDIQARLIQEHSKRTTEDITEYIGNDPTRFGELMQLFFGEELVLVQRSAWVLSHVCVEFPELILPYQEELIQALQQPIHPAVQRNLLKILAESKLPLSEDTEGHLVNICFDLIPQPHLPAAIRVHAMQYIANSTDQYPELAIELKTVIEDGMEHGTAGFRSRGKKILTRINPIVINLQDLDSLD